MDAEDFFCNQGGQRQVIEHFGTITPDVDAAILAKAFIVETIDLKGVAV